MPVRPFPPTAGRRAVVALAVVALAVAACGPAAPSAASSGGGSLVPVDPTPVVPSPSPGATGWFLRARTSQAIPPVDRFAVPPTVLITADGRLLAPMAVPAIFPGPLVMPFSERQVSAAGRQQVLAWASDLGLLSGRADFTGGLAVPGGVIATVDLVVDGAPVTITGIPDVASSETGPGSPAAFADFWSRLNRLPELIAAELGPETPYTPTAYAILVGRAPAPQDGIAGSIEDWPLDQALGLFGGPVAGGTYRCGLAEGADAAALAPALGRATQLTQWVQDPTTSATFGLTVRIIVAGENPCAEAFGP